MATKRERNLDCGHPEWPLDWIKSRKPFKRQLNF
jgi:hypothetical protein